MHKRIIEKDIKNNLNTDKILLLLWARQVWKTTLIKWLKEEIEWNWEVVFFINLENPEFLQLLNEHPENLFRIIWKNSEKVFVFIDEIQYLKNPSNFLKYIYDEYKWIIKLVVTWSSAFYIDRNFKDSLAGRKKIFNINSLSFEEYLIFKWEEKLIEHLDKQTIPVIYKTNILNYYYDYIKYGWYPEVVLANNIIEKKDLLEELGLSYIKKDMLEANVEYEEKYYFILKMLSSQIWNLLNINEIANTINLNVATVEKYIYIMQKSFHIAIIKPFYKNIRKELTKMPKVYFLDTGLRNFFVNNFDTYDYRLDKWELLENIVFNRFLKNYNTDDIRFWRTQNKNEVDFVIEREKKAFEIKVDKSRFNEKKYKLFTETYNDFSLEVIDLEKSLFL